MTERIENIRSSYEHGNKESSLKYAAEAEEIWKRNVSKIDMLLYHDYVDDISKNIVNLKTYIKQDDTTGLYSNIEEVLAQINSIKKSEFPTLENII